MWMTKTSGKKSKRKQSKLSLKNKTKTSVRIFREITAPNLDSRNKPNLEYSSFRDLLQGQTTQGLQVAFYWPVTLAVLHNNCFPGITLKKANPQQKNPSGDTHHLEVIAETLQTCFSILSWCLPTIHSTDSLAIIKKLHDTTVCCFRLVNFIT